jgi:c-di-GMP-binding flagellar brake protein YcgR
MHKESNRKSKRQQTGERRKFVRFTCRIELKTILDFNPTGQSKNEVKAQEIEFHKGETGTVLNISERGMAIELGHMLPKGLLMKVAIANPVGPPIETDARVVWSDRLTTKKEGYIVGMQFRHTKEKHQRNLQRLIEFLKNIPE